MKLKYITLGLENCDSITIDGKYIGDFVVKDFETEIRRVASNAINKVDCANTFIIEIHKDANKERYSFDQTQIPKFKHMTFDRLNSYFDITHIEFELFDDYAEEDENAHIEHYSYWVNWTGEFEDSNAAQHNYISKDGNLYIVISADKTIEDFFDKETIDDSDYMDFHFDMCDVGDVYGDPDRYNKENNEEEE